MTHRFDQVLDDCADRIILRGETVEDCLARYPEHAAELRRYLPAVASAAGSCRFASSGAAKDAGRGRLQAELHSLQRTDTAREAHRAPWHSTLLGWQPRWAMAAAAVVLAVVIAGAGTVAAAASALPGDALYPIKLASEETSLALQLSDTGKAHLHLVYAERRADEMGELLGSDDTARLEATRKRLVRNLDSSARIAKELKDERQKVRLASQLGATASRALARLQAALQTASPANSQLALDVLQSSGDAYSGAIESLASRSRRAAPGTPAAGNGTLQLLVAGSAPAGVAQLLVEVRSIEAHLAAAPEGRWVTIAGGPQTFDLVRAADVPLSLVEREIEPGMYTKVRLQVLRATVFTSSGVPAQAGVPGGSVALARPFRVQPGRTTVVTLRFNGARSAEVAGRRGYVITPKAVLLASEPDNGAERPVRKTEPRPEPGRDKQPDGQRPAKPTRPAPDGAGNNKRPDRTAER